MTMQDWRAQLLLVTLVDTRRKPLLCMLLTSPQETKLQVGCRCNMLQEGRVQRGTAELHAMHRSKPVNGFVAGVCSPGRMVARLLPVSDSSDPQAHVSVAPARPGPWGDRPHGWQRASAAGGKAGSPPRPRPLFGTTLVSALSAASKHGVRGAPAGERGGAVGGDLRVEQAGPAARQQRRQAAALPAV